MTMPIMPEGPGAIPDATGFPTEELPPEMPPEMPPELPPEAEGMLPPEVPPEPMGPQPWPPQELYGPRGLPIWWQDDPAAHLASLNEIILDERKPFPLRKLAVDRSTIYEQLAQAKADPMQPIPAEVMGVPLNRLMQQLQFGAVPGMPGGLVPAPGAQEAVVAPGELPPTMDTGSSPGMTDQAQPLGTVGAAEQNMRQ